MATPERIREIIEFATTDAYDEYEQMAGWGVALDDAVARPFQATALDQKVIVLAFDADPQHGLRCEIQREGKGKRWVGVEALDLESLPEAVRDVLEAFDEWS